MCFLRLNNCVINTRYISNIKIYQNHRGEFFIATGSIFPIQDYVQQIFFR